jgi:hypothetical protein
MKKQLTPNQTLWIFGSFAFLIFILASYTFLNFWQAFRMNSDVQAPPEAEITSKPTLLEHGVNVTKTGQTKISISDEQTDGLEEVVQEEPIVENTASVLDDVHQPKEKASDKPVGNSEEDSHDKMDNAKPVANETQNTERTISVEKDTVSKPLASTNVQKQTSIILTANATAAPLPFHSGGNYKMFPECLVYSVDTKCEMNFTEIEMNIQNIFKKYDSYMSLLATFYDQDRTKFNLQQTKAKDVHYNMIMWDGYLKIDMASTYTFLLTWVVPPTNSGNNIDASIGLQVKDQTIICSGNPGRDSAIEGQLDVYLNVGWNKLCLCVLTGRDINDLKQSCPVIRYNPLNAITELRKLKPIELYHKLKGTD